MLESAVKFGCLSYDAVTVFEKNNETLLFFHVQLMENSSEQPLDVCHLLVFSLRATHLPVSNMGVLSAMAITAQPSRPGTTATIKDF